MLHNVRVKLGLPSKVVHTETKKMLRQFPPNIVYDMARFNPKTNRGITTYSYGRYPYGVVFGKLGGKFAGYIT